MSDLPGTTDKMVASIMNAIVETTWVAGFDKATNAVNLDAARDALLFAIAVLAQADPNLANARQICEYGERFGNDLVKVVKGLRAQFDGAGDRLWGAASIVQ